MNPAQHDSILSLVLSSGLVVQLVLVILVLLSIWSWAISVYKYLQYTRASSDSKEFNKLFWETRNLSRIDDSCRRLSGSPLVQVFNAGYRQLNHQIHEQAQAKKEGKEIAETGGDTKSLEMALSRAVFEEASKLEKGLTFLATVASSAPFIGLFGTVWGIMNAFRGLKHVQSTTLQAVAPGISEALIATAIGLAAAIPAAIAYNYFNVNLRRFRTSMASFSREFLSIAEANFV